MESKCVHLTGLGRDKENCFWPTAVTEHSCHIWVFCDGRLYSTCSQYEIERHEPKVEKKCTNCKFGGDRISENRIKCNDSPGGGYINVPACHLHKFKEEKKMDKETAIINHRHMWNWLSENPERSKHDYLKIYGTNPQLDSDCFLCQYNSNTDKIFCENTCILVWPSGDCIGENGLFKPWANEINLQRRSELARQIRDLPEREESALFTTDFGVMENRVVAMGIDPAKVMKYPKLTREEAITKTRKQWEWLALNPKKDKRNYFKENRIPAPKLECYLCEFTRYIEGETIDYMGEPDPETCGTKCLFKWPGGCCTLPDSLGLWQMWHNEPTETTKSLNLRTSIARLISRLPEKDNA